jgi:membrane protease YdiL (CAAX protease family)
MTDRQAQGVTGIRIAFLVVALMLMGEAADRFFFRPLPLAQEFGLPFGRIATFLVAAAILFGVPRLRRLCASRLAVPIARGRRKEVAIAFALAVTANFAVLGAAALAWWMLGGEPALARRMGQGLGIADPWTDAFTPRTLVTTFFVGAVLAAFIEELVFRGILYRTWEARWGWVKSAFATSLVFAMVHPYVLPQFFASLVLIALYRRTGSLRACIAAHALMNISSWHPLIGQLVLPGGRETGEIAAWGLHLAALAVALVAVPLYLWMARDGRASIEPRPADTAAAQP